MKTAVLFPGCLSKGVSIMVLAALLILGAQSDLAAQSATDEAIPPLRTRVESVPETVTLTVYDQDIQDILALFSRSRGVNIISSADVEGSVSLDLHDVPFDQALQAAVAMAGFQVVKRGDIYFVSAPAGEDAGLALLRDVQTFRLDYAQPQEILAVITEMLSPVGRATSYAPMRTLVAEDRPDVLRNIDVVIQALDIPPRQVLIEAKIIEVRMSKDVRIGIDWSTLFDFDKGSISQDGFTTPAGLGNEGLFVSWGDGDFTSALEGLETVEELNTLAAPRLLAVDGTEAEIIIGGQLGFSVVTTVENTVIQSVQFLDTGAQLKLTPTITGDGYVLMKIHPELSDGVIQEGLPSKTTAEVTTDVLIKDGDTLLIGGLIRERDEKIRKGIPILRSIPVLGMLFGKTETNVSKSELIALITPRILQPGETIAY